MKSYLLFRNKNYDLTSPLPSNSDDLIEDLALERLFSVMAKGEDFIYKISKHAVLTGVDQICEITYRQNVLRDCLKNQETIRRIYNLCLLSKQNKHRRWLGIYAQTPRGILSSAVNMMQMFSELLKQLKIIAENNASNFNSEGLKSFFSRIQTELGGDYIEEIDRNLENLQFNNGMLASVRLGKGNEGSVYTLRLPKKGSLSLIGGFLRKITGKVSEYSFLVPARDEGGHRALEELVDRSVNEAANALAQTANHIDAFFQNLQLEIGFYLGCINLYNELREKPMPTTFPEIQSVTSRDYQFDELYDICLALTTHRTVVGNQLDVSDKELFIITGANQGGKSTFLRSIGLAQLMMQAGMFVAADNFSAPASKGLFTHFRREEDTKMEHGKLDEELDRMSNLVDHLSPNATILLNESFSSTKEVEGSEIAYEIVKALLACQVRVFFVTHMVAFARLFKSVGTSNVMFLRAERESNGLRTYKLKQGEPLDTSYGKDIFREVFIEK